MPCIVGLAALLGALLPVAPAWAQDAAERPLQTPAALQPDRPDPERGVLLELGVQQVRLRAGDPDVNLAAGGPFSDGAVLGVAFVRSAWRVVYTRRLYRHELPEGTTFKDAEVDFLSMESDQVWGFYGVRPLRTLYLGAGVGLAHRRLRFSAPDSTTATAQTAQETRTVLGLLLDYAVFLPYSLQVRVERDTGKGLVELEATTVGLGFHVPF